MRNIIAISKFSVLVLCAFFLLATVSSQDQAPAQASPQAQAEQQQTPAQPVNPAQQTPIDLTPVDPTQAQPAPSTPQASPNPAGPVKPEVLVAYYGHPNSRYMGIVGRHSLPELVTRLKATTQQYQALMPNHNVVPAIYLIYGTVQPEGRIAIMNQAMVNQYIEYGKQQGVRIILDHQIGRHTLQETMDRILPFLANDNVHLAVDFEWRTTRPMREVGFVRGEELTWMQSYMSDYLVRNNLPGTRYLIFHQFNASMVRNHAGIRVGFPQVDLIHSTSGWGPPWQKRGTHAYNATITQIPSKAFKLWYYYSDKPGIHYDNPLMTPAEVIALSPQPKIIIYQ